MLIKQESFLSGINLFGVELQLLAFQYVAVSTTGLSRAGANAGQKSLSGKLIDQFGINGLGLFVLLDSILSSLGLFLLDGDFLSLFIVEVDTIVIAIPLCEGSRVNGHDAVFNQCIGTNQLIVGCVIDHIDDSCLAGDCLRSPVEVSFLETESSELEVTSTNPNSSNPGNIIDKFGVGDGSSLFVGSLLLVDGHSASSESSLVSGISVYSHVVNLISN